MERGAKWLRGDQEVGEKILFRVEEACTSCGAEEKEPREQEFIDKG